MCHVSFVTFAMSLSEDGKRQLIAISNLSNAKISEYPELNRPLRPTDFKVSMMLDTDAFLSASYGRLSVVKRISGLFEGREDELHIVSTAQLPPQV